MAPRRRKGFPFKEVSPPLARPESQLNMAELEFSVLARQCLDRRIADLEALRAQVTAWSEQRNRTSKVVHWRFPAADARVKLHHLYPVIKD